ncbi:NADH dehydrogenase, alpha subcomplex, subunit 6 [Glomus cerebriforme]|uniref:NADH dehydrogenase, alpha subcomplex, subunit 6 n=1 Tax=Glomus cerebriforme TaxID=658196 RepID=A0A397TI90_9GLOM|nr:NADH dehydrogenase, alpha subcomplex, subunit 6 [Glomus cerebriforme]
MSALTFKTTVSPSLTEAKQRVLHLYRDWQRAAPKVVSGYLLDIPISAVRAKIREEFEKNRHVQNLRVIDILIFKGRAEYQETVNIWKLETHVMNYFSKEESPPKPQSFLETFYEGRD